MPLRPTIYGNMLRDLIAKHHVDCWLVNTGWTGGKYGEGRRMPIRVTRRLLAACLTARSQRADFRRDPDFGFAVPSSVPGVEPHILYPVKTWANKAEFDKTARRLIGTVPREFQALRGACRRERQGGGSGRADCACLRANQRWQGWVMRTSARFIFIATTTNRWWRALRAITR